MLVEFTFLFYLCVLLLFIVYFRTFSLFIMIFDLHALITKLLNKFNIIATVY